MRMLEKRFQVTIPVNKKAANEVRSGSAPSGGAWMRKTSEKTAAYTSNVARGCKSDQNQPRKLDR